MEFSYWDTRNSNEGLCTLLTANFLPCSYQYLSASGSNVRMSVVKMAFVFISIDWAYRMNWRRSQPWYVGYMDTPKIEGW